MIERSSLPCGRLAAFTASSLLLLALPVAAAPPAVGPNVNMVSGTQWPKGDPFLTKQNEPSLAVSSRNARHLLAGSNDYRLVPVEIAEGLDAPEAWIQIYKSVDGGQTWRGTPLGGCPLGIPECADSTGLTAPLLARHPNYSADPTARSGPSGTFFLSFIAGTRDTGANGVVAVQRFVDKNNDIQRATDVRGCTAGTPGCAPVYDPPSCTGAGPGCTLTGYVKVKAAEDPILPDVLNIIDVGTPGQTKDKPWVGVDVGGRSWNANKTCELLSWTKNRADVTNAAETVPAFNVYVSYANFTGGGQYPDIYVATSSDCGKTFRKPIKISQAYKKNQGTSSFVDPLTGAIYVVWRNFDGPQQILMNKSTDGGLSWGWPVRVATFNPYDQGATGVSFRSLDYPSVAVSVKNGVSRVHVAWVQRKVAPNATAPYACPSANPADCDARIVVATSKDGGNTWPAAVPVDNNLVVPGTNPGGRGHQVQASLTFAAGKLLATWLDNRLDHSEGYLKCPNPNPANCTNVSQLVEARRPAKNSNLDPACHIDVSQPPLSTLPAALKNQLDHCNNPAAVWTTYITDGTPGLVRRHTLDAYTAMADPADVPAFTSSRVSQYTFGTTVQGTVAPDGTLTPVRGTYDIVQKEANASNLPMFFNGRMAFIGDYIDSAGQIIVATNDRARPYKFNVGGGASGPFVTSGLAPVFHVAFTDNRDVIPPLSGDWTTPTCTTTAFKKDVNGNIIGVDPTVGCGSPGYAGNRNQNVYTAAVTENSAAFANANSKLLNASTQRGFSVTVRNLSDVTRYYKLTVLPGAGVTASFDSSIAKSTLNITVQPRSASARTVWVKGPAAGTVVVDVKTTDSTYTTPDGAFVSQVTLNPDATCATLPGSSACAVTNGDGGPPSTDTALDSFGNVVLSNAVLTNNVLSNNALSNAVLSNNALTNAALSNVVLSNAALTNNALSNVVLSNVVLSNNALNAALTNLDPANVALSNAVLSNNALTNVALSNNALSNVMLTNNALTNAALSNVALSNAALSNNALSNDSLRNVALSNAPLSDASHGTDPDADPLRNIEPAAVEITKNPFVTGDLANSNFKETTFTIRNHGNIDTTLAIKLMLRDAICTGAPSYTCTTPPGYKLQLVLRKVALVPVAIPPTGPAVTTGRAIRIGLGQSNTEVSNVSDLPLIDPSDPNFGKFLPDDPNAAMLTLATGEYAYATIRAIGVGGATPPDPADLLRWGVKTVASNATTANGPLVIRTLNFPTGFTASPPAPVSTPLTMFGGKTPITGNTICTDKDGNAVLNAMGAPTSNVGVDGNYYIDTTAQWLYGPKTLGSWGAGVSLINPPDLTHPTPYASVPCPPASIALGPFTSVTAADGSVSTTAPVTFTPKYWGDFYTLASVADANSPAQTDRQVIKVHVDPRPPVLTYSALFPTTLTYKETPYQYLLDLAPLVSSDSENGAGATQPILFAAAGACTMHADGHSLLITQASPPNCTVTVSQLGNEIFAPATDLKQIFIDRASQTIAFSAIPTDHQLKYNQGTTLVASVSSTTAPASGLAVTFTSLTSSVCTTSGTSGVVTVVGAGTCTIQADQGGDSNYKPATPLVRSFIIDQANQAITFGAPPAGVIFGDAPVVVSATSASPTAPPSGIAITFSSQTPLVCTNVGATVTIVAAGICTIAADQAGNANYNPAPQVTQSFAIAPSPTQFTVAVQQFTPFGSTPTTTGKLNRPGKPTVFPTNTATVVLKLGGATLKTYTPTPAGPDGAFTIPDATIPPETYTVTFDYAGSANFLAAPQATSTLRVEGFSAAGGVMSTARQNHSSTLLPDGNVLVTGGIVDVAGTVTASADLYCTVASGPCTALDIGKFKALAGMATPRWGHSATRLADGNVLVAGGVVDTAYTPTNLAEVYCAAVTGPLCTLPSDIGTFKTASAMSTPRRGHTATLLADNRVLVTGGYIDAISPDATDTAELYCAAAGGPCGAADAFLPTGAHLALGRIGHTATLLGDGTVLVAGGNVGGVSTDTAEIYCVAVGGPCTAADAFQPIASLMSSARAGHGAALLGDGRVLVAGGLDPTIPTPIPTSSVDVFCAVAVGPCVGNVGSFLPVGALVTGRASHTLSVLTDGWVLAAGGVDGAPAVLNSSELFEPGIDLFATAASMAGARYGHAATRLPDGRVLVTGGRDFAAVLNTAELYNGPF